MADKNILIIEDSPTERALMECYLEDSACLLSFADNGSDGIHMAQQLRPHLIILDLALPGLNGLDVFEALRSDDRTKRIPLLVATGLDNQARILQDAVERLGMDHFIQKPLIRQDFVRTVEKLLLPSPNGSPTRSGRA